MTRTPAGIVLALAVVLAGCPKKEDPQRLPVDPVDAAPPVTASDVGDAVHGKELVLTYQCNRCHDGTGHPAAEPNKHCVHCHKDIMEDRFKANPASIAKWKPRVKDLQDAPSLEATGKRFTRAWLQGYVLQPSDLRPHLKQYMPRLAITTNDARDIAAYLAPETDRPPNAEAEPKPDLGKGRQLVDTKGCGSCHVFTGVAALANSPPPAMDPKDYAIAHTIAPDLRVTRDRMPAWRLRAWLRDPKAVKSDTLMPKIALTEEDQRNLAGYILEAEVTEPPAKPKVARLPVLTRKVTFKEVDEKVFHRTCWHCHSEPDYAIGDGGPGNSGGFGFKPRGLNLSSYIGISAGFVDDKGERENVFAKDSEGVPRLVRAMVARHEEEEQNVATGAVRGMPLGYDPLPLEDIQLVESWIAQGRPQ
jgi:mono/diheme cytochrome c family protein